MEKEKLKTNETREVTFWETIAFPLGFDIGLLCSIIITIIIKGKYCVA